MIGTRTGRSGGETEFSAYGFCLQLLSHGSPLYLLTMGPSSGLYSTRSFATFATESSGMVVWLRSSAMSNLAAGA